MDKATLLHLKLGALFPPQLKDNGAFASNTYVDTAGLDALLAVIQTGTIDAILGSTDTSTAPYLEECDTTDGTYAAVSSGALTAVIAATDDNELHAVHVDLTKSHKRYMRWNAPTSGDGTTGDNAVGYFVGLPSIPPVSAADMGLSQLTEA